MTIPTKSAGFVSRSIGADTIIVPVRAGVGDLEAIFTLNSVGATVWSLIDGKKTVDDLSRTVCRQFEVSETTAAADVAEFLDLLASKGLVTNAVGAST